MQSNAQNECKASDEQTIDNTINDTTGHTTSDDTQRVMSKNQMKKLLRHKKWLETRPERRRQEKERKKLKAKKLREEGIEMKSRSALRKQWIPMSESKCKLREEGIEMKSRSALRKQWIPMSESKCKVSVCIDCDFEDYMEDNDMKKLVKQIGRCYAFNRHSSAPVQLYITSIKSKIKEAFVRSQPGFANWDAICVDRHWSEVFADKQKVIYLSSDSEDIIPEPNSICESNDYVFVIGGLVDHLSVFPNTVANRQVVRHFVPSEG
ncbi:unnamed protein product [Oppiella nova]|uniref:tRNA (guanine(9)-N(1))-methyltransferase n=1 Tax=Oppiella nova TaxID=334625 RepID=A0A7R9M1M4_9ACAR|nr:unnamed protein product [Oppiella nova]CAG2169048.1 unnamed protein product [Oppiella nova]